MAKKAKKEEKLTQDSPDVVGYFEEKAEKAIKAKKDGAQAPKVSLKNTIKVQFTRNYGFIKKGHVQKVSEVAYEMYQKAGVVEKV